MKESIFAIIAAKDEEKHISGVVKDTLKFADKVIVIDDGSKDLTKEKAEKAGAIALEHIVNLGKGAAIKTGCEYAISKGAGIIVLLDADGQHEPKDIPRMVALLKDSDVVFGMRKRRKSMPLTLRYGNWFISKTTHLLFGIDLPDTLCGFRAFKAKVYRKIRWQSSGYSMESEMIANIGKKRLKYSQIKINTIYSDKYKGTTMIDGIKIVANMLWWKITRW